MDRVKGYIDEIEQFILEMTRSTGPYSESTKKRIRSYANKLELAREASKACRGNEKKQADLMIKTTSEKILELQSKIINAPVANSTNVLTTGVNMEKNGYNVINPLYNSKINTGNEQIDVQVKNVGNKLAMQNTTLANCNKDLNENIVITEEVAKVLANDNDKVLRATAKVTEMNNNLDVAAVVNERIRKNALKTKIILYSVSAILLIFDICYCVGFCVTRSKEKKN